MANWGGTTAGAEWAEDFEEGELYGPVTLENTTLDSVFNLMFVERWGDVGPEGQAVTCSEVDGPLGYSEKIGALDGSGWFYVPPQVG